MSKVSPFGGKVGEQLVAHRTGHASLRVMEQDAVTTTEQDTADIEEELLVEEISIDGMCGVY
jgi:mycofactocin precursor